MTETAVAPGKPQTLDDIMIAMDVVDTLRHREDLVRRELSEEDREADLIARLRKIYKDQGIDVPDSVLADGVKALKESRFVYTPPPRDGSGRCSRYGRAGRSFGKRAAALVALVAASLTGYHVLVTRPAQLADDRARVEITQTLPKALRQAHADVLAVARRRGGQAEGQCAAGGRRAADPQRRSRRRRKGR